MFVFRCAGVSLLCAVGVASLFGCPGTPKLDDDDDDVPAGSTSEATPPVTDTDPDTDTDQEASSSEETGATFLIPPDGGGVAVECDVWSQDCPSGEKCMPWVSDGGSSWNATRCTSLTNDPNQPGDPCTVEGNGPSIPRPTRASAWQSARARPTLRSARTRTSCARSPTTGCCRYACPHATPCFKTVPTVRAAISSQARAASSAYKMSPESWAARVIPATASYSTVAIPDRSAS